MSRRAVGHNRRFGGGVHVRPPATLVVAVTAGGTLYIRAASSETLEIWWE